VWRRSKGTPDAFAARIFDTNRKKLREILSGGELFRRGLVDLPAILEVLDDPRPVHGHAFRRLLQFADVEAWATGWNASGR
jgi:asparagine synthase (glutamine-hydrolysing)